MIQVIMSPNIMISEEYQYKLGEIIGFDESAFLEKEFKFSEVQNEVNDLVNSYLISYNEKEVDWNYRELLYYIYCDLLENMNDFVEEHNSDKSKQCYLMLDFIACVEINPNMQAMIIEFDDNNPLNEKQTERAQMVMQEYMNYLYQEHSYVFDQMNENNDPVFDIYIIAFKFAIYGVPFISWVIDPSKL